MRLLGQPRPSFYNSNPSGFDQFQPSQFPVNYPPQETSKEILRAREDLMEAIQAFLKEYDHTPPNEKCVALLLAEERFLKIKKLWRKSKINMKDLEIKHALTDKQYRQEDIQELMSKLLEDVRNISEELSEYINCPSWNRPTIFYDNDDDEYTIIYSKPKEITPDLPIEEPDNSLNHSEILSDSNNDGTSSDDDDFEDTEYVDASPPDSELVSLEEVNDVDEEKEEIDLEDILQIQDDNDSFFEKSDTSFSDNSLPEFESFSDHTEETSSGSTTTHANNSLPEYDSFHFEIEPDQGEFTSIVMEDILGEPRVHTPNVLPTHPILLIDSDFIIRTFLPYFTYPVISYFLFSSGSEDTIFDPGISTFHFSSLKLVAHENPIVIFLFFCFCPKDKGIRGEIPHDHEDPCLFSILQSSGL
ncbi:hypothetical protein Tco_0690701 [Tanacetum coccineum]